VPVLTLENVRAGYGGLTALAGVSIGIAEGDFVSIVGPNGAGKTTLFKCISGIVTPTAGSISFAGRDMLRVRPCDRPHLGIAHVPEGRQVFPNLTVLENLEMGAITEAGQKQWPQNLDYVLTLFPVLADRRDQLAGTLSGGEQQMLAIGRGLASAPRLLMLDEPSMGLAPAVADQIFESIASVRREKKVTILMVEQRAVEALEYCDRGYVLETGRVVLSGTHDELREDDRVRKAYLGM
jgi:branched-chain amino acid transport system ATP-binding protein